MIAFSYGAVTHNWWWYRPDQGLWTQLTRVQLRGKIWTELCKAA
jgi:hypothetical protein